MDGGKERGKRIVKEEALETEWIMTDTQTASGISTSPHKHLVKDVVKALVMDTIIPKHLVQDVVKTLIMDTTIPKEVQAGVKASVMDTTIPKEIVVTVMDTDIIMTTNDGSIQGLRVNIIVTVILYPKT